LKAHKVLYGRDKPWDISKIPNCGVRPVYIFPAISVVAPLGGSHPVVVGWCIGVGVLESPLLRGHSRVIPVIVLHLRLDGRI